MPKVYPLSHRERGPRGEGLKKGFWLLVILILLGIVGCAAPTMPGVQTKAATPPAPIKYCFDGVPHIEGSLPFALGGTCCHTPTQALLDIYQNEGLLLDYTAAELQDLYREQGIQTAIEHQGCNNLCANGPHVAKGGKCMAPPTPGTENYEEVLTGIFNSREKDEQQFKRIRDRLAKQYGSWPLDEDKVYQLQQQEQQYLNMTLEAK